MGERKYMTLQYNGFSRFKKCIAVHLKHSSFWPSADVKPM
jgi:hypothetical protein